MRTLPGLDRRLAEKPMQRSFRNRPAAEAHDRRVHRRRIGELAQRDGDVAGERPAHADVDRPVDDDDVARARQRLAQAPRIGNGRKATSVTRPIARPSARISSITSLIVPLIDPIATTSVSAPSAS